MMDGCMQRGWMKGRKGGRQMDGWMDACIAFPKDRLNGKKGQRRQTLKKGGQKHLTWWPEAAPGAAELNLRPSFAT